MRISIITVCFNSEKTIERTIKSVAEQDYKDIEYIIIDGKSEDRTLEICKKYLKSINILISEKDKGIYDAMNKGLALATGEIIAILNSDDYFSSPSTISEVVKEFDDLSDVLIGNVTIFSERNNRNIRNYKGSIFKPFLAKFGIQPPHPATFVKKKIYQEAGNFDTQFRIAADFDFLTRILVKRKINYKIVDKTLVMMSNGGVSNSSLSTRKKTTKEILISLKKNKITSNSIFVNLRFAIKAMQFFN